MTEAAPQRPRLLQAMVDSFRQVDVRQKLLFTLAMLVVFRFVAHVPVPNVNKDALGQAFDGREIFRKGLPRPVDAGLHGRRRDVLRALEVADDEVGQD